MAISSPSSLPSLVAAHVDLVYSAALRQVRDPHLADDVTQTVFLVLARKLSAAPPEPHLAPWLLKVTRYTALTALRASRRRAHHEFHAAHNPTATLADHEHQLTTLLDEALMSLAESDRSLLIRRYLQNHSVADIAASQNLLPNTAAKKIQRALEKLRAHFTRRGITTTDAALAVFLPTTLLPAPSSLTPAILTAAASAPGASSIPLGVLLMSTKLKLTIAAAAILLLASVTCAFFYFRENPPGKPTTASTAATTKTPGLITAVELLGNTRPDTAQILQSLALQPGKIYTTQLEIDSVRYLVSLNRFSSIRTNPIRDQNSAITLQIFVTEIPTPEQKRLAQQQIQARQLIYQLRYGIIITDPVPTYIVIRQLVAIGKLAVPELIAELDRTTRDSPLRALTFTLRAIDDPRAVPALIRALPRTQVMVSDYGNTISDRDLWQFVTDHTLNPKHPDTYPDVSIPRANREIIAALEHMTHVSLTKRSLGGANSDDPAALEHAQLLRQLDAETWQDWWNQNAQTLLSPDDLAFANATPSTTDLVTPAGEAKFGPLFPSGPKLHLSETHEIFLEPQGTWDTRAFFDLDANRAFCFAQQSRVPYSDQNFDPILWDNQLGIDIFTQTLMNHAPTDPPGVYSTNHHELDTFTTRVWPIENGRWDSLESELHAPTPLDPGKWGPSANLEPRNIATGELLRNQYPATFLFITKQGGRGILQLLGDSQNPPGFKFRYRLVEGLTPIPAPILPTEITPPQNLTFSPETQITLHSPTSTDPCALDLDTGKTTPAGNTQLTMNHEGDIWPDQDAIAAWLKSWHGDILVQPQKPSENLFCTIAPNMSVCPISVAAWQNLSPADLVLILSRKPAEPYNSMTLTTSVSPPRSTYAFKTREGSLGVLQFEHSSPTVITLHYKILIPLRSKI